MDQALRKCEPDGQDDLWRAVKDGYMGKTCVLKPNQFLGVIVTSFTCTGQNTAIFNMTGQFKDQEMPSSFAATAKSYVAQFCNNACAGCTPMNSRSNDCFLYDLSNGQWVEMRWEGEPTHSNVIGEWVVGERT